MKHLKIFKIFIALLGIVAVERFCYLKTKGFRFPKASTPHEYPFAATIKPPPENLFQPFYFLDKGVQFYVFIGEDQKTILKLFKHHHTGPSYSLVNLFPKKIKEPLLKERELRMCRLLKSVKIAEEKLKNETALLYTHLGKTEGLFGHITLYDAIGVKHNLNLDKTEFVLQKRIDPTVKRLYIHFSEGKVEEAILCMQRLLDLVEERSKLGVKNKDKRILQNTGFLDSQPIEVDLGSFVLRKKCTHPNPHKKAREKMAQKLIYWVEKHYPIYSEEVKRCIL